LDTEKGCDMYSIFILAIMVGAYKGLTR